MTFETSSRSRCAEAQNRRGATAVTMLAATLVWCGLVTPAFARDEDQASGYCETHPDGVSLLWNIGRLLHFCPDSDDQAERLKQMNMPLGLPIESLQDAQPVGASSDAASPATQLLVPFAPANTLATPVIQPQAVPAATDIVTTPPPTTQPTAAPPPSTTQPPP